MVSGGDNVDLSTLHSVVLLDIYLTKTAGSGIDVQEVSNRLQDMEE